MVKQKNIRFLVNGIPPEDKTIIATSFNQFFTNIGDNLDKEIPKTNTDPISFIKKNYTVNIFLNPTSPMEIDKIIQKLKSCSVRWDNFPASILKDNSFLFSEILAHLINISLLNGVFPNELKIGNIIPLYKAGNEDIVGNYRPVSILSTFSENFRKSILH